MMGGHVKDQSLRLREGVETETIRTKRSLGQQDPPRNAVA